MYFNRVIEALSRWACESDKTHIQCLVRKTMEKNHTNEIKIWFVRKLSELNTLCIEYKFNEEVLWEIMLKNGQN